MKFQDLTGQRFGRLTVVSRKDNIGRRTMFECRCDCGNIIVCRAENLKSGNTTSCGCYLKDFPSNYKHEFSKTRLEAVYNAMLSRCYNKNSHEYYLYGLRGIKICDEWLTDRKTFYLWATQNGFDENVDGKKCLIDRIDVNGNYCPENCRFVDSYTQANNTRRNIYYSYNGETHTLAEWSRICGINHGTLYNRINKLGWTIGDAITLPVSTLRHK